MQKGYKLTYNGQYIHIVDDPGFVITIDAAVKRFKAIADACEKHNCKKVLIEADAPKRKISTLDAFDSGSTFSDLGLFGVKIAFCFTDYTFDETSKFLQVVASNRGLTIAFFNDLEKALSWLK